MSELVHRGARVRPFGRFRWSMLPYSRIHKDLGVAVLGAIEEGVA